MTTPPPLSPAARARLAAAERALAEAAATLRRLAAERPDHPRADAWRAFAQRYAADACRKG